MVRLTDRPDMTFDVYPERKTTTQQLQQPVEKKAAICHRSYIINALQEIVPLLFPSEIT